MTEIALKFGIQSCACKGGFKVSKDGFSCVANRISDGAIAGIVIACIVVVAIAVGVTVFCLMKKSGKCGGSKKSSAAAKGTMNDTVTGNNDTALAQAGAK